MQFIVTPEIVAMNIKTIEDNESLEVDGTQPNILLATIEQTNIPFARVFNLSIQEGVVPFEWKKQISSHYLKRIR